MFAVQCLAFAQVNLLTHISKVRVGHGSLGSTVKLILGAHSIATCKYYLTPVHQFQAAAFSIHFKGKLAVFVCSHILTKIYGESGSGNLQTGFLPVYENLREVGFIVRRCQRLWCVNGGEGCTEGGRVTCIRRPLLT